MYGNVLVLEGSMNHDDWKKGMDNVVLNIKSSCCAWQSSSRDMKRQIGTPQQNNWNDAMGGMNMRCSKTNELLYVLILLFLKTIKTCRTINLILCVWSSRCLEGILFRCNFLLAILMSCWLKCLLQETCMNIGYIHLFYFHLASCTLPILSSAITVMTKTPITLKSCGFSLDVSEVCLHRGGLLGYLHPRKPIWPLKKGPFSKGNCIFQPSIFRVYVTDSGSGGGIMTKKGSWKPFWFVVSTLRGDAEPLPRSFWVTHEVSVPTYHREIQVLQKTGGALLWTMSFNYQHVPQVGGWTTYIKNGQKYHWNIHVQYS